MNTGSGNGSGNGHANGEATSDHAMRLLIEAADDRDEGCDALTITCKPKMLGCEPVHDPCRALDLPGCEPLECSPVKRPTPSPSPSPRP